MKIAIYETVHLDWIIPLCEMLSGRSFHVSFFTSTSFKKDLIEALNIHYHQFQWTYLEPDATWNTHYIMLKSFFHSNEHDIVILNSVDSRHLLIHRALAAPGQNKKILINIHDVNNFFTAAFSFNLRKILRALGKRRLAQISSGYIVNSQSMKKYIETKALTHKPVFWISPVISRVKHNCDYTTPPFIIVIPGSIDERRRDYLSALEAFEKAFERIPGTLEMVLAGSPAGNYGQLVINKTKKLLSKGLKLTYFNEEIKEVDFQKIIAGSHFVFSPAKITTSIHDGIEETYGLSKNSGNIYDAIRHGKPLISPSALNVPEEIQSSCLNYDSTDSLIQLFTQIGNGDLDISRLSQEAYENSQQFSRDKMVRKMEDLLLSVTAMK